MILKPQPEWTEMNLHTGWGGLGNQRCPRLQDRLAPYGLFPRMSMVIHHGGSGTTAFAYAPGYHPVWCRLYLTNLLENVLPVRSWPCTDPLFRADCCAFEGSIQLGCKFSDQAISRIFGARSERKWN
jgi:hypothetical protein